MNTRGALGAHSESLVAEHLARHGFELLARNARLGRLEIDLIARRGPLVVFCEVRSRTSASFMDPIASIDFRKVQRLRTAAIAWLRSQGLRPAEVRFDAAAVVLGPGAPQLRYYEAAF